MRFPRKSRTLTALIALLAVLFMQWAVASYVCPNAQESRGFDTSVGSHAPMQSMPNCDQPDSANPALCQAHCQDVQASLDKPVTPVVLAAASLVARAWIRLEPSPLTALPSTEADSTLQRITSPPISIRHCCFRI